MSRRKVIAFSRTARRRNSTAPLQKFPEKSMTVQTSYLRSDGTRHMCDYIASPVRPRGPGTMLSGFRDEFGGSTFRLSALIIL